MFCIFSKGTKNEPWKNPQIKVRLGTEQRIAKGKGRQWERGEREGIKIAASIGKESKQNNIKYDTGQVY